MESKHEVRISPDDIAYVALPLLRDIQFERKRRDENGNITLIRSSNGERILRPLDEFVENCLMKVRENIMCWRFVVIQKTDDSMLIVLSPATDNVWDTLVTDNTSDKFIGMAENGMWDYSVSRSIRRDKQYHSRCNPMGHFIVKNVVREFLNTEICSNSKQLEDVVRRAKLFDEAKWFIK